jgi:hypothetical protein
MSDKTSFVLNDNNPFAEDLLGINSSKFPDSKLKCRFLFFSRFRTKKHQRSAGNDTQSILHRRNSTCGFRNGQSGRD